MAPMGALKFCLQPFFSPWPQHVLIALIPIKEVSCQLVAVLMGLIRFLCMVIPLSKENYVKRVTHGGGKSPSRGVIVWSNKIQKKRAA